MPSLSKNSRDVIFLKPFLEMLNIVLEYSPLKFSRVVLFAQAEIN